MLLLIVWGIRTRTHTPASYNGGMTCAVAGVHWRCLLVSHDELKEREDVSWAESSVVLRTAIRRQYDGCRF